MDRIQQTLKDIERGFIAEKSLSRKQKCIFLDRDGTINPVSYTHLLCLYKEESGAGEHRNQGRGPGIIESREPARQASWSGL